MRVVGVLLLGLGLAFTGVNLAIALRNHAALRSRAAHLFLAAGFCYFAGALALRPFYAGWRAGLLLLGLIVVSEAAPLALTAALALGVSRRGQRLEGADLSAEDLRQRDLRGARLRGADLRRARLGGADLRDADLTEADLSNADLNGALLVGATLAGARFEGADLRGTEIYRVSGFESARYSHETVWPAEMDPAAIPGAAQLRAE